MNVILENYKMLQEEIKNEKIKKGKQLMQDGHIAEGLKILLKEKVLVPGATEYLKHPDAKVRIAAMQYLIKAKNEEDFLEDMVHDENPQVRIKAIELYFDYVPASNVSKFLEFLLDEDYKVKIKAFILLLESGFFEDTKKFVEEHNIIEFKDIFTGDSIDILKDESVPKKIKVTLLNYIVMNMPMSEFDEKYFDLYKQLNNDLKKQLLIWISKAPETEKRLEKLWKIEGNDELKAIMLGMARSKIVEEAELIDLINETKSVKLKKAILNYARRIDSLNFIDEARRLINNDELAEEAAAYAISMLDYEALNINRITEWLESKSLGKIRKALAGIKKLKYEEMAPVIYNKIIENKKYPTNIRTAAINTIKMLKLPEYANDFMKLTNDIEEDLAVRETALKAVARLDPSLLENLHNTPSV